MIILISRSLIRIIKEHSKPTKTQLIKTLPPLLHLIDKTLSVTRPNLLVFLAFHPKKNLMLIGLRVLNHHLIKRILKNTMPHKNKKMVVQCYLLLAILLAMKLLCNKKPLRRNKLKSKSRE